MLFAPFTGVLRLINPVMGIGITIKIKIKIKNQIKSLYYKSKNCITIPDKKIADPAGQHFLYTKTITKNKSGIYFLFG